MLRSYVEHALLIQYYASVMIENDNREILLQL